MPIHNTGYRWAMPRCSGLDLDTELKNWFLPSFKIKEDLLYFVNIGDNV